MGIEITRLTSSESVVNLPTATGLHTTFRGCASGVSHGSVRLRPDWSSLLSILPQLGQVRCVTSNRHARLQMDGCYPEYQSFGCRGLFTTETFDLRFCLPLLDSAFAVASRRINQGALNRSIHFYDDTNTAVHSVLLSEYRSVEAFENLIEEFIERGCSTLKTVAAPPECLADPTPICAMHKDMFLEAWGKLKDTLSFGSLLRSYGVSRHHAFALAQGQFTKFVEPRFVRGLLDGIVVRALSVNVRIGNPASEHVYRGSMRKLDCTAGALVLCDRHASVQIEEQSIAAAWIVTIPTKAGRIKSLEFHASDGQLILAICGVRTQAGPQECSWHEFLADIPHTRIEPDPNLCTSFRPQSFGHCQVERQARMGF